jgi:asparagine synthase (glutamine-hydrolysing)
VVLDGTGADEAVGLMPPRHVRLAVGHASRIPAALRRRTARALRAVPRLAGYAAVFDFEHPADTMSRWNGFSRAEIERLTGEPALLHHAQFFRTYHRFGRQAHFERYSALLNAMTCDRVNQAMAMSGTMVRFPFWQVDTDRFIRQLRTDFRYLPGQPKRILRALLARYLPAELWNLPKHGFNFPLRDFLAADDHRLVHRHLDPARWAAHGLLRAEAVRQFAQRFFAGEDRLTFRVWALVVLGAWLDARREPPSATA